MFLSAKQTKLICTNCSLLWTRFTLCSCFAVIFIVTLRPPLIMRCVTTQIKAAKEDEKTPDLAFPVMPSLRPSCLGLWWQFQNPRSSPAKYRKKIRKTCQQKSIFFFCHQKRNQKESKPFALRTRGAYSSQVVNLSYSLTAWGFKMSLCIELTVERKMVPAKPRQCDDWCARNYCVTRCPSHLSPPFQLTYPPLLDHSTIPTLFKPVSIC